MPAITLENTKKRATQEQLNEKCCFCKRSIIESNAEMMLSNEETAVALCSKCIEFSFDVLMRARVNIEKENDKLPE